MPSTETASWTHTRAGVARGYIQPASLDELWFHTGTNCNLRCPFCLEGSKPGDNRIELISAAEARAYIDEAIGMGVRKFSFTGGEPFVNPDMVAILDHALDHRPCLVLTNGTEPLINRLADVLPLIAKPHELAFRISLDYADPVRHDKGRGPGNFRTALRTLGHLHRAGFQVSIARQMDTDESDRAAVDAEYRAHFAAHGLPEDTTIVAFPDFAPPSAHVDTPEITENCMTTYLSEAQRDAFMCNFSKMIVKKGGRCGVYACTLVDDDADYDLAPTLAESMKVRVMLRHHRCFSCFAYGASCSEGH